jgi:hypothetical protein
MPEEGPNGEPAEEGTIMDDKGDDDNGNGTYTGGLPTEPPTIEE